MSTVVLDTSVAAAWYLPEKFAAAARTWQQQMLRGATTFVVPRLHHWEMANLLRSYVQRGEIERELAIDIYSLHLEAPLVLREPDAGAVLQTALDYQATAYDAVYIALSIGLDLPILTAERSTRPWIVKLGKRAMRVS